MGNDNLNRWWLIITAVLILIIVATGAFFAFRYNPGREVLISQPNSTSYEGQILIDGAIAQPGYYPLKSEDTINTLVGASGGLAADADRTAIHLYIPHQNEVPSPQKVDINRAEVWLLEALPGIGNTKAQAILSYRQQNGAFHNVDELTLVPGISESIFQKLKELVAVSD
jgi:competence protein ComEA